MAFGQIGVDVKITGVTAAIGQLNAYRNAITSVVTQAKKLSGIKVPKLANQLNIANISGVSGGVVKFDQLAKSIDQSSRSTINFGKFTEEAKSRVSAFSRVISGLTTVAKTAGTALSGVGRVVRSAFGGLGTLGRGLANIPKLFFSAVSGIRSFGSNLNSLGRSMTGFGSIITTLGFRLSALVSIPLVGVLTKTAQAAANFQTEMLKLKTLSGLSAQEMRFLADEALRLAPALGAGPQDILEGLFFITSSGIRDMNLAIETVEAVAKASALGLGELETVANAATSVLVAYGSAGVTAADAVDLIAAATDRGKFETDELSGSLKGVLGVARALGVEIEDVFAGIASQTLVGFSPREAATRVEQILVQIEKAATSPLRLEALQQVGLTLDQVKESIADPSKGLIKTLIAMRQAFDDAGVPLAQFFTRVQSLEGVLTLTGENAERTLENLNAINNAGGIVERGFADVAQTTNFQWEQLKATLQVVAITIGDVLLPAINKIIQAILPVITAVGEFAKTHPQIVLVAAAFAAVTAVIVPLLIVTGALISSLGAIFTAVGAVISVLGFFLSPLGLVLGAVLALASALGITFVLSINKMAEQTGNTFDTLTQKAFAWGKNIVISLARGIAAATIAVVNALISLGKVIKSWLGPGSPPKLLPDLPAWGQSAMQEFLKGFSSADFGVFNDIAGTVSSLFRSLVGDALPETGVVGAILGSRKAIAQAIQQIKSTGKVTESTLNQIAGSFGSASENVKQYARTMLQLAVATEKVRQAQEELDKINKDFEDTVKPLNDELAEIDKRFQEVKDAQERARLEDILADKRAPELAKELARLSLRRLDIEGQISQEEEKRDKAVESVQARLDLAKAEQELLQEQANAQKALIDAQVEHNELLREQADLLESLIEKQKKAAEEGAGAFSPVELGFPSAGDFGGVDPEQFGIPSFEELIGEGIRNAAATAQEELGNLWDEILGFFDPLIGEGGLIDRLTDIWTSIFLFDFSEVNFKEVARNIFDSIETALLGEAVTGRGGQGRSGGLFVFLRGLVSRAFFAARDAIAGVDWASVGRTIIGFLQIAIGEALKFILQISQLLATIDWIGIAASILGFLVTAIIAVVNDPTVRETGAAIFNVLWEGLKNRLASLAGLLSGVFEGQVENFIFAAQDRVSTRIQSFGAALLGFFLTGWATLSADLINVLVGMYQDVVDWFADIDWEKLGTDTADFVVDGLEAIKDFVLNVLPTWFASITTWIDGIDWEAIGYLMITGVLTALKTINDFVTITLPAFFTDVWTWFTDQDWAALGAQIKDGIIDGIQGLLSAAVTALNEVAEGMRQAWHDFWDASVSKVAMEDAKDVMKGYIAGINSLAPELQGSLGDATILAHAAALSPSQAQAVSSNTQNTLTFGPVNVNNGMDQALFEARVRKVVSEMVRV